MVPPEQPDDRQHLLSRWVVAPQELPAGVLTALLGGGYLLWLMQRQGVMRGIL